MLFYSTRTKEHMARLEEAVFKSLPADNGLYMPLTIPKVSKNFLDTIDTLTFNEIAEEVTYTLLKDDVSREEIKKIISLAYDFDAPVISVDKDNFVLELFHGPSMAFKDFGARFMAALMSHFLQKSQQDIKILVATSGDTGGAVAQGFFKVPGIEVVILYPSGKVSDIQEKQLTTLGHNVRALEIDGTFDDCQRLVKSAFLDEVINKQFNLASANSINIARLIPQSFYYFYAYAQLKKFGKPLIFSVPSGNFGNLSAGLLAYHMGLPVDHFIAATNSNHVVPDYLSTGEYNPVASVETIANAMDVGNPSNFVRMIRFFNDDWKDTASHISGFWYDDNSGYVLCPHTAIAYRALLEYRKISKNEFLGVFLSTAHPAKFIDIVEENIGQKVDIPQRLNKLLSLEKQSVKLDNSYDTFRNYLLNNL
jgi:threonine synthase